MGGLCSSPKDDDKELQDGKKKDDIVREKMKESDWQVHRLLGKGAFGTVMSAELKANKGTLYALKYMNKHYIIEQNMVEKVIAEKEILRMVNHPFVCKLHYAFQTPTDVVMVLSLLIGGDLQFHLDSDKKLNEMGVRFYVAQISLALGYLHELGIVHRDIKPGNILLDSRGNSYITDFGISAIIKPGQMLKSNCGTLHYMPPEVYRNELYNHGMDMWALGVIMYEMLYQCVPFDGSTEKELMAAVCSKTPAWVKKVGGYSGNAPKEKSGTEVDEKISPQTKDFCTRLLDKNKATRMTAKQAKDHPFFALLDWNQVITKAYLPPFTPNKDGNIGSNVVDVHEHMGGGGETTKKITAVQQELFKNWDYNPAPEDEATKVVSPLLQMASSKKLLVIEAAPMQTADEDDEEDEDGAISAKKYKQMQEEKKRAQLEKQQQKQQADNGGGVGADNDAGAE